MENAELDTLAARVRFARKQAGLTQVQLAERVGVSQPMIGKIENGSETSKIVEIATQLEVRPQWLASGTGPMTDDTAHEVIYRGDEQANLDAAIQRLVKVTRGLTAAQIEQIAATVEALKQHPLIDAEEATRVISPTGEITDTAPKSKREVPRKAS